MNVDSVVGRPFSEEGRRNYDRIFGKKFDVFLACAPKDYNKLPFVIEAIKKNVEGFDKIWVCSPNEGSPMNGVLSIGGVLKFVHDDGMLPCDRSKWKYRPNWNFQQHLKLFQNVTSDWYVTIDCDTIINRPMEFWRDGKPIWYKGWDQVYKPYFEFNKKILGLDRIETRTFIADMNFFYRPFIQEMLARGGYTIDSFIKMSQKISTEDCHIAEPELYGQYVLRYHPDFYQSENLKQGRVTGRTQKEMDVSVWGDEEIEAMVEQNKGKDIDTFSLHSWYTGE